MPKNTQLALNIALVLVHGRHPSCPIGLQKDVSQVRTYLHSGNVHDAVAGRLNATFEDLGALSLKNIERPIQAFMVGWTATDWSVAAASFVTARPAVAPLALLDKPSVAVLPFDNMSGDAEQAYFADGICEDLITALSRVSWLFGLSYAALRSAHGLAKPAGL